MKALICNTWDHKAIPIHEYTIVETQHPKTGNTIYRLTREGLAWSEFFRGTIALEVEDTGNEYIFSVGKKKMGYDEATEMYIMYKFLDTLGKERRQGGGIYEGTIEFIKDSKSITI